MKFFCLVLAAFVPFVASQVIETNFDVSMNLNENGQTPLSFTGSHPTSIDEILTTPTGSRFEVDVDYNLFDHKAMLNFDISFTGADGAVGIG